MARSKKIPMKEIRAIAKRIAENFDVEKIILFGSYAYGKPREYSDVDLCVVMDFDNRPFEQRLAIRKTLPISQFSVDLIVRKRDDFRRRIPQGDWFLKDIWEKGKVLYDKRDV